MTTCPFCRDIQGSPAAKGNLRHYHLYCQKSEILNVREKTYDYLEVLLSRFFKVASTIPEMAILYEDLLFSSTSMTPSMRFLGITVLSIVIATTMF